MRDDSNVRRFRVGSFWLKLLAYCFILLIVCAAGGIFAGYKYWRKTEVLVAQLETCKDDKQDMLVHLERLQNMEKILQSNDPEELQTLLGSISVERKKEEPPVDLSKLFATVDLGLVKIENLELNKLENARLKLNFDLSNSGDKKILTGVVKPELLTKDGRVMELEGKKEDLDFQIQRFKKMSGTLNLPDELVMKDIFGLRLTIHNKNGKIIFSETYPIHKLLP